MAKKALGMGIDALLGSGEGSRGSERDKSSIPIDSIDPNPEQPRKNFDMDSLKEMAESIKAKGILQPILVEPAGDRFSIIAGERRFRAARLAGLETVPAVVREFSEEEKLEIALIENIQREDLNPLEEAEAYKLIMEKGSLNQAEVAARVGKQRSTVANSLRLLKLPEEMKQKLSAGTLSAGHARALLAISNEKRRKEVFERILLEGLSVREAEQLAGQDTGRASKKPATAKVQESEHKLGPELREFQERLIEVLGTRVAIRGDESRGRIEISYFSMDDLERIFEILDRT